MVDAPVTYYYWGIADRRISFGQSGPFVTFFYAEDFDKLIYRNKSFIEFYICRTTEGSTLGYKAAGQTIEPVLAARKSDGMAEEVIRNQEFVMNFARNYRQYICLVTHSEAILHSLFLRVMNRFSLCPVKNMIVFLHKKILWGNFYSQKVPVIIKLYPWTVLYIATFYCLRNVCDRVYKYRMIWMEASLVYTYGALGKWLIRQKERLVASKRLRYFVRRLIHKY